MNTVPLFKRRAADVPRVAPSASIESEFAPLLPAWQGWLQRVLASQVVDGSSLDGAIGEHGNGWYDGRQTGFVVGQLLAIYLRADLVPHDHEVLARALRRGMAFLLSRQHADGRLDLGGAYSPNEAGFPATGLAIAYARLQARPLDPLIDLLPLLETFLRRAGEAILAGSAYTANHRWTAACAPLAALHRLWPDPRYLAKIEDYLSDGLDCDADGCWFEERSPNYNGVANMGVLALAGLLDRADLNDVVVRNGRFVLRCLQPNGEIDSSFSLRQDRAEPGCRPATYGVARRWAQLTGDGRFTALAQRLLPTVQPLHEIVPLLFQMEDHPGALPAARPIEDRYDEHFSNTSIFRRRRGRTALTLAADPGSHFYDTVRDQWGGARHSDDWFHLHHGPLVIQSLHLAGAGLQNIQPRELAVDIDGRASLGGRAEGWTHTLLFRPDSPACPMTWNWGHAVSVEWKTDCLEIEIDTAASTSLASEFRLWVRPGATWAEGDEAPAPIQAGVTVALKGGLPLHLRASGATITFSGLPVSAHRMHIVHPQPIPSAMPRTCGCLALGLVFPVKLKLSLRLA